jgi:hypothetical protein
MSLPSFLIIVVNGTTFLLCRTQRQPRGLCWFISRQSTDFVAIPRTVLYTLGILCLPAGRVYRSPAISTRSLGPLVARPLDIDVENLFEMVRYVCGTTPLHVPNAPGTPLGLLLRYALPRPRVPVANDQQLLPLHRRRLGRLFYELVRLRLSMLRRGTWCSQTRIVPNVPNFQARRITEDCRGLPKL